MLCRISHYYVVQAKLFLYLINQSLYHEGVWRNGVIASPFLASPLSGGKGSTSLLGLFNAKDRIPGANWIGGWVGLDVME
jgi:hypothetical protein